MSDLGQCEQYVYGFDGRASWRCNRDAKEVVDGTAMCGSHAAGYRHSQKSRAAMDERFAPNERERRQAELVAEEMSRELNAKVEPAGRYQDSGYDPERVVVPVEALRRLLERLVEAE